MNVILCDPSWESRWNAFIDAHADASFYHRYGWLRVNARAFGHHTVRLRRRRGWRARRHLPDRPGEEPAVRQHLGCSMPFVNYGGPVADTPAAELALLAAAETLVCARAAWTTSRFAARVRSARELPTSTHKVSMTIDLEPGSRGALWNGVQDRPSPGDPPRLQERLRRASRRRRAARRLLRHALRELARSRHADLPARAISGCSSPTFPDASRICVVFHGTTPAAARVRRPSRRRRRGHVAGHAREVPAADGRLRAVLGADQGRLRARASSRFHLGRSTADSGGETFKKKWNATATQLYWQYLLRTRTRRCRELNPDNPKYQLAIDAWRRLPVSVTQVIGPVSRGHP